RAAHDRQRALVFLGRQAMLGHDLRRDRGLVGKLYRGIPLRAQGAAHASASTSPSNNASPSEPPNIGSTAFSGCGISPITVLLSLNTPPMFWIEPVGFPGAVT